MVESYSLVLLDVYLSGPKQVFISTAKCQVVVQFCPHILFSL